MDKQGIIETSKKRREGERIFYTSCPANGCWDSACVLKCHEKDGKIIAIEPDDSVNPNDSREDCGWENTWKGNVQMRPCAMGHSWKKELHADTRLLHPMKRVGKKGPGQGYFVQISWEEALDTIAEKMKEIKGKYGPYGIFHSQYPSFEKNGFPLAPWWEAGFGAWGEHSTSGHAAGEMLHLGVDLTKVTRGLQNALPGFEAPDLFNSKLFIMWGMDPVVAWFGPTSYYMQLAHEYGLKTIVIDPRYTQSAEILADQWIPIRPGTDLAMMLAVAQVLFEEDLVDHEFIDEWVDKEGFEEWRAYVMGEGEDGLKKTPEWAAPITAVPADTIREFARLYGTEKPVHLQYFYSCAKRHMGDYSASASMLLQAMTGNIACHGGCESGACLPTRAARRLAARSGRLSGAGAVQQQLPHRDSRAPGRLLVGQDHGVGVPSPHRQPHQRLPAAQHSDDHLREQLRQQPLECEQALRRHGQHRVQLGLPVAHEPAHR